MVIDVETGLLIMKTSGSTAARFASTRLPSVVAVAAAVAVATAAAAVVVCHHR
jgi:hypothetical protein